MLKSVIAVLIILVLSGLAGCAGNGRVGFSPPTGSYELMLEDGDWRVADGGGLLVTQLLLIHAGETVPGMVVRIDYHRREFISNFGVSDLDSFIGWRRTTLGTETEAPVPENVRFDALAEMDMRHRDVRGGAATSGKRQQIAISNPAYGGDIIEEHIFLETDEFYFAITYGVPAHEFAAAQAVVNDLIRHLRVPD